MWQDKLIGRVDYRTQLQQLVANPSTSDWLKAALIKLNMRDPVDALHDAQLLTALAKLRLKEMQR